ncbi:MAG: ABC-type branched-subunit amino acid transport system ATPase component [Polaribacter sp.]|jgi:ABC-type branched-subunit amino acid transport system ATPase component
MRLVNLSRGMIIEPKISLVNEILAGMSDEMRDAILNVLVSQAKALNQTLVLLPQRVTAMSLQMVFTLSITIK